MGPRGDPDAVSRRIGATVVTPLERNVTVRQLAGRRTRSLPHVETAHPHATDSSGLDSGSSRGNGDPGRRATMLRRRDDRACLRPGRPAYAQAVQVRRSRLMSRFPQIESRVDVERLPAARDVPRLAFVGRGSWPAPGDVEVRRDAECDA
jgi:hypothetical protein